MYDPGILIPALAPKGLLPNTCPEWCSTALAPSDVGHSLQGLAINLPFPPEAHLRLAMWVTLAKK